MCILFTIEFKIFLEVFMCPQKYLYNYTKISGIKKTWAIKFSLFFRSRRDVSEDFARLDMDFKQLFTSRRYQMSQSKYKGDQYVLALRSPWMRKTRLLKDKEVIIMGDSLKPSTYSM